MSHAGWHETTVHCRSAATGLAWDEHIRWRTTRVTCCGQTQTVADADRVPVVVDGSYGDLVDRWAQCGGCGTIHSAKWWTAA